MLSRSVRSVPVRASGFLATYRSAGATLGRSAGYLSTVAAPTVQELLQKTSAGAVPITTKMEITDTLGKPVWPCFRVMDTNGKILPDAPEFEVDKELTIKMYKSMVGLQAFDDVFYNAQRQGRISFYMQNWGEEASHIGSASALAHDDMVFAQYREAGVLFWRGFSVQQAADQCFSNEKDLGKGRQMPVHYGSRELHYQTISSPLTTQLPQAVGAAYAFKLAKKDNISMCYFGEGAASEGDFHAALNFSSTLDTPMIFFCRNNGYAISTPTTDQFRSDGIIARAAAYGMHGIRVDGNDIFAVQMAVKAARKLAVEKSRPVLIEAMTYRRGHHSTSDDSTRYRKADEIQEHADTTDPVARLRAYMQDHGWWDDAQEKELREKERNIVLDALQVAENRPKPDMSELFTDVYQEKPAHLLRQEAELLDHISKYPEHYKGDGH
jgi:2-oxoisovalerate dehydrogenase E1 component alpha subunit